MAQTIKYLGTEGAEAIVSNVRSLIPQLVEGDNITLTPDENDPNKITISSTASGSGGSGASTANELTCTSAVYGSGSATTNVQTALTNLAAGVSGIDTEDCIKETLLYDESDPYKYMALYTDLNNIKTPGFYRCGGGNSLLNKPTGVDGFGMIVIQKSAGSAYFTQKLFVGSDQYTRHYDYSTNSWTSWIKDELTDTTYSDATQSVAGLMSTTDKTKLDGINIKTPDTFTYTKDQIPNEANFKNIVMAGDLTVSVINDAIEHAKEVTDTITLEDMADGGVSSYTIPYSWTVRATS